MLRATTKAVETEGDLTLLRARTRDTPLAVTALRHDRGPEFVGARTVMQKVEIIPIPSVDHGAPSDAVNLKVQVGTRRTRMHAGLPELLWPIAMNAYCFCVAWWWAAESCKDVKLSKHLTGGFVPIPVGAGVQYLPRVTEDRKKTRASLSAAQTK